MIIDDRTPEQRAKDAERCPTCGHRPQDAMDRLMEGEMGSAGIATFPDPHGDRHPPAAISVPGTGVIYADRIEPLANAPTDRRDRP